MKLSDILTESTGIKYISPYDEYGEMDYELVEKAEHLVRANGLNMLRDDEVTDIALDGDEVVGVLFSAVRDGEMNSSIVVDPKYRGSRIATTLFDSMYIDETIKKHVAELVAPYTMEQFLIKRGYTFTGTAGEFRLYEKEVA